MPLKDKFFFFVLGLVALNFIEHTIPAEFIPWALAPLALVALVSKLYDGD